MTNKPHYIYALIDPDTREVRYVGMSTDPEKRLVRHMGHNGGMNPVKIAWAISLKDRGRVAQLVILESHSNRQKAKRAEGEWINHYLRAGSNLTNRIYPGCEGMNKGRRYSTGPRRR